MKRSLLVRIVKRIHGAYEWGRYWANSCSGAYRRNVTVDGNPASLGENVCIVSIFSASGRILRSTSSLIRAIRKEGYHLVVVVNGQQVTRQWFEGEIGNADVLITRPNLGRDFAAYQFATNLISQAAPSIRRLLYCNDSIFCLDRNDPHNIFARLISSNDDWIGMTENYEHRYHVSSWCFQLSTAVLNSPALMEFWKTYRPVDNHRHAIRKGEIGLSKVLLGAGFVPTVIFNTGFLLGTILEKHKSPDQKLLLQQLSTPGRQATPHTGLGGTLATLFRGEQMNQTNNLGILLIYEIGFPFLKKTMARAGNCPISLMLVMLEELMSGFCTETANEVRLRGMRKSLSPLKRLLIDAGVI